MSDSENFQAPQPEDAETLHAALLDQAQPDGRFERNFNVVAAEIGWSPERVSVAMQALVADGLVEPLHADGDPARIAASSWRVGRAKRAPAKKSAA